tara:strand:- start:262 stop:963 length:702 start_codon:yes stop_codon:yes gene_type:complete
MAKLIPGTFLYNIVYGNTATVTENKPFYVQNADDYVRLLKKNYEYYGIPFKKPNVEEIPPYNKVDDTIETHVEQLDQIVVKLNVLKSGKVRVKILPHMAILNEKYYSKGKPPPIKSITSALKALGYSQEFMDSTMGKYKKRNQIIEKRWKILEKKFDAPSTTSRNKKKKMDKKAESEVEIEAEAEAGADSEDDETEEKKDDDEPEEDEAIEIDEEGDEEEAVEDEYVSDGGDE